MRIDQQMKCYILRASSLDDDSQTSTKEAKKVRVDNLNRVYDYCLNNVTCRRTQYEKIDTQSRREEFCLNFGLDYSNILANYFHRANANE